MTSGGAVAALVDSWSCPTTVFAGRGALKSLGQTVSTSPVVLVTDERLWPSSEAAGAVVAATNPVAVVARRATDDDAAFMAAVGQAVGEAPEAAVVALGGGSVLDIARLAVLANRDEGFGRTLATCAGAGEGPPMCMWPAARDAANPVVCIPTTLGTAAEVSPIAVVRRNGATRMLVSPALRSRAAVLDPVATAGLSRPALLAGLLEPLSRVLVPAVAGESLPLQDGLATAMVRVLFGLGVSAGPEPDADWRLAAALASCQTHTAFLSLGRSPFGHALWPFATEFMAALGVTKAVALAMLMPAWLRGLASGDLGPAFGSAARVRAICGRPADEAVEELSLWLGHLGVTGRDDQSDGSSDGHQRQSVVAPAVTAAVSGTWQATGFFLPGATGREIEWLTTAALGS